jgi:hypothetical protein
VEAREEVVKDSLISNKRDARVRKGVRTSSCLVPALKNGLVEGEYFPLDGLQLCQHGPNDGGDGSVARGGAMAVLSKDMVEAGYLVSHQRGAGADSSAMSLSGRHLLKTAAAGPH